MKSSPVPVLSYDSAADQFSPAWFGSVYFVENHHLHQRKETWRQNYEEKHPVIIKYKVVISLQFFSLVIH